MTKFSHLFTHRYEVRLPGSLSRLAPRHGFLLRVEFSEKPSTRSDLRRSRSSSPIHGYADLMSWPELGDLSIEEEVLALLTGKPTALGTRALEMAEWDAEARSESRSLWTGVSEPPLSHFLAGDLGDLKTQDWSAIGSRGFRAVKAKWPSGGFTSVDSTRILSDVLPRLAQHGLRLRLDCNGSSTPDQLISVLSPIASELLETIEFLEDPFHEDELMHWRSFREKFPMIALFVDRVDTENNELLNLADGWVLKPALQGPEWLARAEALGSRKSLAWTQYLGHALGAAWAAWDAARAKTPSRIVDSGLVFESEIRGESAFLSEAIRTKSAGFPTDRLRHGEGIGWTEADFSSLTWSPCR